MTIILTDQWVECETSAHPDDWCWSHNRLTLNPRAITSGMPTQTASRERQMLKWGMRSNPQQRRFQS